MRHRLRWKIMAITVLPLVTLVFATLWVVNRSNTRQVYQGIHDDLRRASSVLENLLGAREQSLAVAGEMTAQDPKFFSVLTLPGTWRDAELRATVGGVARDFNAISKADLFAVTDAQGHLVADVGRDTSDARARVPFVHGALLGRQVSGVLVQTDAHYQVCVTPVLVGGRVVGTLMLGARIGGELAERLRQMTRSEVTFVSLGASTASTLESGADRDAVRDAVRAIEGNAASESRGGTLIEVHGGSHLYITLVRPLPQTEPKDNQFYVMQRAIDAETANLRETQTELLGLGILAALVALLAGFLIAERITAPVQRLVRGAEEMEHGNYDFPLAVRSQDEIGELATRFEDMRRRQREYVHSLQEVARVKSEFISIASHELSTPISVMHGFNELMLMGTLGEITPQQKQALEATAHSIETLARIAQDATRMAQIDGQDLALKPARCAVASLLDEALARVRELAADRRVAVACSVSPRLDAVIVDGASIVQALINVIGNAVRFTPDGGRVEVRAEADGEWAVILVRDNGVGIEPERQRHLLERSFNVRDSRNHHSSRTLEFNSAGLGLGLPIARGIVEAHGGAILLESAPGKGTTVAIRIPLRSRTQMEKAA